MKNKILIVSSLAVLVSGLVGCSSLSGNGQAENYQSVTQIEKSKEQLKYRGIKIAGRTMTPLCEYSGMSHEKVYVPQDSFDDRECPKTIEAK